MEGMEGHGVAVSKEMQKLRVGSGKSSHEE